MSFIDDNFAREVAFLKELVKVPSDNPPGDTARHGEKSAELYEGLGFKVERHKVPEKLVNQFGMKSVTNLVIREKFGTGKGPVIALNAHGDVVPPGQGWTHDPYGAEEKAALFTAAAPRCRNPISPPTASRCWRSRTSRKG